MAYSARTPSTNLLTQIVSSVAHGFTVGQVLKYTGTWGLAQADSESNAQELGMVSFVPSTDTFYVTQVGHVYNLPFPVVDGTFYYLSPTVAGDITATKPTAAGQYIVPLFRADSTSSGFFMASDAYAVGSGGFLSASFVAINTSMVVNQGYITSSGGTLNMLMPSTANVGDTIYVTNDAGQFSITQPAGLSIRVANLVSTVGVGGSVTSNSAGDSVILICKVANTGWQVIGGSGTVLTVV